MDMTDLLVYGAYGYTGELVARKAVAAGHDPILAGRRERPLRELTRELDCSYRAFDLGPATPASVGDVDVVAHCAGPFIDTYQPMVEACIETGTHYLDITGEIDVFEAIQAYDEPAREAGVMLLPGAGFDVVPTDCLANHLHERLPDATDLTIAFSGLRTMSAGTAKTVVEGIDEGAFVREDGLLEPIGMGERTRRIDLGDGGGEQLMAAIPWGDVSTAYHSTGVPNIEVYTPTTKGALRTFRAVNALGPVLGSPPVKTGLRMLVEATVDGPSERERVEHETVVWGEATDGEDTVRSRVTTAEPYEHTGEAVVHIVERALDGDAPVGYRTPASAYGPELVCDIEDTRFEDLA
jgi:short subunit dehydrogenase-like uncharacterized protein